MDEGRMQHPPPPPCIRKPTVMGIHMGCGGLNSSSGSSDPAFPFSDPFFPLLFPPLNHRALKVSKVPLVNPASPVPP